MDEDTNKELNLLVADRRSMSVRYKAAYHLYEWYKDKSATLYSIVLSLQDHMDDVDRRIDALKQEVL